MVRVRDVDRAIDLAVRAEHGCGHTASIYSRDVNAITRMAREIDVSIFVANAANLAGLGDGGEGYTSFSIASPTGEGLTRPRSFSRERRMISGLITSYSTPASSPYSALDSSSSGRPRISRTLVC